MFWKNSQIFGRSDIFYSQLNPKGSSWPCYYPAYANAAGRPCLKRPSKKERKKRKKRIERKKERPRKERKLENKSCARQILTVFRALKGRPTREAADIVVI